jgi:hypothetical protein
LKPRSILSLGYFFVVISGSIVNFAPDTLFFNFKNKSFMKTLTSLRGQKVKAVDAAHSQVILTDGTKLRVKVVDTDRAEPQKGAVAQIRKLAAKGKSRSQLIAAGYNPHTVSTQLYKLSHE